MTSIDEAIAHEREVAEEQRKDNENCKYKSEYGCKGCADYYSKPCIECAEEHEQLAEWLEELKEIKSNGRYVQGNKAGQKIGYRNAIDDLSNKICMHFSDWEYSEDDKCIKDIIELASESVEEIAERLKEGGESE